MTWLAHKCYRHGIQTLGWGMVPRAHWKPLGRGRLKRATGTSVHVALDKPSAMPTLDKPSAMPTRVAGWQALAPALVDVRGCRLRGATFEAWRDVCSNLPWAFDVCSNLPWACPAAVPWAFDVCSNLPCVCPAAVPWTCLSESGSANSTALANLSRLHAEMRGEMCVDMHARNEEERHV